MIKLTVEEIKKLAEFAGLVVSENRSKPAPSDEVTIKWSHGTGQTTPGMAPTRARHVAYWATKPEKTVQLAY